VTERTHPFCEEGQRLMRLGAGQVGHDTQWWMPAPKVSDRDRGQSVAMSNVSGSIASRLACQAETRAIVPLGKVAGEHSPNQQTPAPLPDRAKRRSAGPP
jgi:hypothetical protein